MTTTVQVIPEVVVMTQDIKVLQPCPVCLGPYTAYVRHVPTTRTMRQIPLYTCLECQSFWNPGDYAEDEAVLKGDLQWGIRGEPERLQEGRALFSRLAEVGVKPTYILDIGGGIGSMLVAAEEFGMRGTSFDINKVATDYGQSQGRDTRCEFWSVDTPVERPGLIMCIHVLEHFTQPREMLANLCQAAERHRAALYITLPIIGRDQWQFLLDADPKAPGTPFMDNDVHVTHFSPQGLKTAMEREGARNVATFMSGTWWGLLARNDLD